METKKAVYIPLKDLEVYQLARKLSEMGWKMFETLTWQDKKIMGDQFIESTDSVGANIAEGYGRFHYLDRIKFYYNGRASYMEAKEHWLNLLFERNKISKELFDEYESTGNKFLLKLNNFISVTYKNKYEPKPDSNFN
jgi:four helix bundle protein